MTKFDFWRVFKTPEGKVWIQVSLFDSKWWNLTSEAFLTLRMIELDFKSHLWDRQWQYLTQICQILPLNSFSGLEMTNFDFLQLFRTANDKVWPKCLFPSFFEVLDTKNWSRNIFFDFQIQSWTSNNFFKTPVVHICPKNLCLCSKWQNWTNKHSFSSFRTRSNLAKIKQEVRSFLFPLSTNLF